MARLDKETIEVCEEALEPLKKALAQGQRKLEAFQVWIDAGGLSLDGKCVRQDEEKDRKD